MTEPRYLLIKAHGDSMPKSGDRIEFASDRFTDKGPASGTVEIVKTTVDGYYLTVKISDGQATLSWDDMKEVATKKNGVWMIKSLPTEVLSSTGASVQAEGDTTKIKFAGFNLVIENPAGTIREGVDETGKAWRTEFAHAYGEITGSMGVDGDPVDVYVGPDEGAHEVYIVRQMKRKQWDQFDEDKCFIGFASMEEAKQAYLNHYDDPRFFGGIIGMPLEEFRTKVYATKHAPQMIKALIVYRRD